MPTGVEVIIPLAVVASGAKFVYKAVKEKIAAKRDEENTAVIESLFSDDAFAPLDRGHSVTLCQNNGERSFIRS